MEALAVFAGGCVCREQYTADWHCMKFSELDPFASHFGVSIGVV